MADSAASVKSLLDVHNVGEIVYIYDSITLGVTAESQHASQSTCKIMGAAHNIE